MRNYVFYSKSISIVVNSAYNRKVIDLLNYLCYYAAVVCTSYIFTHFFLGNRISWLVIEISYCKSRVWFYCKVFNKEYNTVILFSKCGKNFNRKLFDNQTPALTKRESKFCTRNQPAVSLWNLVLYDYPVKWHVKSRIT